jgi:hypothetical protein
MAGAVIRTDYPVSVAAAPAAQSGSTRVMTDRRAVHSVRRNHKGGREMRFRSKLIAVLVAAAVAALTLGPAGASAQSPVPTQQASESAEQYVQRLDSLGYSGWLIPKTKAPRRR